jgi:potassium-dependent mechanosensitive channel
MRRAFVIGAVTLLTAWSAVESRGQQPDTAVAAPQPAVSQTPGAFEVATRARQVADSSADAEQRLQRLGSTDGLRADLADATRRHAELQALLASLLDTDYVRPERISRLRDQALLEDQRLESTRSRVIERTEQLGVMRAAWLDRQRFWRRWQQELRGDPDLPAVQPDLARANARIDAVLDNVSATLTLLLALQRGVEDLRADNERMRATLAALRTGGRAGLLQREQPLLFSALHRQQLAEGGWRAWDPTANLRVDAHLGFILGHLGVLLFHVLLAVVVGVIARRLQPVARRSGGWSGLLEHPWLLGTFTSVIIAIQRVLLAPPLWDVLLWALLGATAAVLARTLLQTQALRLTVYLFAAFYPVFLLFEVAQLPTPVFRTALAAVAASALPIFAVLARRRTAAAVADDANDPRRIWPLRIGTAMWAVVLAAIITGYDALGRWVLHASVTSAAVVFVVVVLLALVRGALAAVVAAEPAGRSPLLRRIGMRLAQRLMFVVQLVTIAVAALVLLDVWQLAESPIATWQRIINTGFALGPVRLTVGRILLGLLVIYIAVAVSWIVRTGVQSEVYRRWDFDRGVGESINRLVHYVLITIGAVIALGVLGVELQNFAIVAGALGIGIGFGLQNVVSNFAAGLILLFERPVRVGDTVVVGGEWGTVSKIGLRSTIMLTFDQSEMIVPNADLVSEKVVNWTLSNPIARIIVPVGVAYGSNVATVLRILNEAGSAHEAALAQPPPQALFTGFGDSSLDFELRIWVREIRARLEVRSAVLAEIDRRFAEAGIEIPFPQRDLHLRSVDAAAGALLRSKS